MMGISDGIFSISLFILAYRKLIIRKILLITKSVCLCVCVYAYVYKQILK